MNCDTKVEPEHTRRKAQCAFDAHEIPVEWLPTQSVFQRKYLNSDKFCNQSIGNEKAAQYHK